MGGAESTIDDTEKGDAAATDDLPTNDSERSIIDGIQHAVVDISAVEQVKVFSPDFMDGGSRTESTDAVSNFSDVAVDAGEDGSKVAVECQAVVQNVSEDEIPVADTLPDVAESSLQETEEKEVGAVETLEIASEEKPSDPSLDARIEIRDGNSEGKVEDETFESPRNEKGHMSPEEEDRVVTVDDGSGHDASLENDAGQMQPLDSIEEVASSGDNVVNFGTASDAERMAVERESEKGTSLSEQEDDDLDAAGTAAEGESSSGHESEAAPADNEDQKLADDHVQTADHLIPVSGVEESDADLPVVEVPESLESDDSPSINIAVESAQVENIVFIFQIFFPSSTGRGFDTVPRARCRGF